MLQEQPKAEDIRKASLNLFTALHHVPISTLLAHKRSLARQPVGKDHAQNKLISVDYSTPLRDVLRVLAQNNLLAVPITKVVDEAHANEKSFVGIVSIYDILAGTVFQKVFDDLQELDTAPEKPTSIESFMNLDQEADAYFSTPVSSLIGFTAESALSWTIHSTEPVSSLLSMLTTPPFHRILVIDVDKAAEAVQFDDNDVPVNTSGCIQMVTQTDVLQFLFAYRDEFAPTDAAILFNSSIDTILQACPRMPHVDPNQPGGRAPMSTSTHVIKVPDTFTALHAFRVMYTHRVSAVAVVESQSGEIVANLSASDLRGMTADMDSLESLLLPVFEFLETKSKRVPMQVKADQIRTATAEKRFGDAVQSVLESRIHRLWVVDASDKPVDVITLGDMLCAFAPAK